MRLKILLPDRVLLDRAVRKVTAEGVSGSFCLLPRHVDTAAALVPGLLSFVGEGGEEEFLATDEGVLVKAGPEVLVSARGAVYGPALGTLRRTIEEHYRVTDSRERAARSAAARLEASLVRRFLELK
jgi:F-type H+-transporting ATPase subunit epsilon